MQPDGPRSNDAAADAVEPDEPAEAPASISDSQGSPLAASASGEAGSDDDSSRAVPAERAAAPTALAPPRHLRESWPPTAEIELDLARDGYHDPDARDEDSDGDTDDDTDAGDDGTGEPKAIGRHRRRRSRRPWLAAGAVAASVTAILIAVGAVGANRGSPNAAPSGTSTRPSLVDTAPAVLPPTSVPSDSPAPTPTSTPTRTGTPTPVATTGTTTGPATSTSSTTAPPTASPPTPTPTPTPTGPTVITVPPHQLVITGAPGRCVDVNGNNWTNGNTVQSWSCNTGGAQKFTFNANGTLSGNGVCLAPAGAGVGSPMQVRTCGGANQVWQFRSDKSLYNPSTGLCLNDPGYPSTNRQLILATCTGAASQRWTYS
jgi:Ricin-type beta-trefoil lectin domain